MKYYRIFALKYSSESLKKISEINDAREAMSKQDEWYAGNGCFLVSSCYLTADLLCQIENIRKSIPFLHLKQLDDTKLMEMLNMISADFSKMGLYFVLQMDIGNMFHDAPTYRQFCGEFQNDVKKLAKHLDLLIDGGDSIEQKLRVEKNVFYMTPFSNFVYIVKYPIFILLFMFVITFITSCVIYFLINRLII